MKREGSFNSVLLYSGFFLYLGFPLTRSGSLEKVWNFKRPLESLECEGLGRRKWNYHQKHCFPFQCHVGLVYTICCGKMMGMKNYAFGLEKGLEKVRNFIIE